MAATAGNAGPPEQNEDALLRVWRIVDAAYCFLTRHRATMSVKNVLQMANSLSASSSGAGTGAGAVVITHEQLRRLARVAPTVMDLRSIQPTQLLHRDDIFRKSDPTAEELELVVMPTIPQISQKAVERRLRLVTKALKENPLPDAQPSDTTVKEPDAGEECSEKMLESASAAVEQSRDDLPSSPWIERLRGLDIYKDQIVHALAQDQLKSLRRLLTTTGLREDLCATFDGDTPMKSRSAVVRDTHIFLTNPDIMHLTILPKHQQWRRVLANLNAKIFSRLVEDQIHTIMFCKGRKLAELVLMSVHRGYSAEDRRRIEQRLFSGELLGVVATNALELGIDIGELDCTMHLGLPGTIASLWQQAGRAGRQHTQQSLAVIVCFDAPLDQHFARHGGELFALEPEAVGLNPANAKVLSPHLVCAAHEIPLYDRLSGMNYIDQFVLGAAAESLLPDLVAQQLLFRQSPGDGGGCRVHSCAPKSIRSVSLRSISEINYQVVTDDAAQVILDEIPGELVFFQVYPTAVYLHQGQEYIITRLDMEQRVAYARRCPRPLTYYTTCRDFTDVDVVKVQRRTVTRSLVVCEGLVTVTTSVFGSTLVEKRSMRVLHVNEFSLPPMQSAGHAVWFELPHSLRVEVEAAGFVWPGALHGVGHLLLAVIPLFVLCDAGDINTEHVNPFERRPRPNRVTMFERRDGGCGVVDEIARVLPAIVEKAWTIARECRCASGCPCCIHLAQCSEYNKVLDKRGSLMVLDFLHDALSTRPDDESTA
ncbi:hypothetical protein ATCC90586_004488 [Pythium insidiosum]|nr:hypothetical protein ATCC90586_004488 [Pythium insidiosum]